MTPELAEMHHARDELIEEVATLTRRIRQLCPHHWLRHPEADAGWWCDDCGAIREEDDPE